MAPLNADEYAPGRTVEKDGQRLRIVDSLRTPNGGDYSLVSSPDSQVSGLLPTGTIRDEFDAVDPEDLAEEERSERERAEAESDPDPSPAE